MNAKPAVRTSAEDAAVAPPDARFGLLAPLALAALAYFLSLRNGFVWDDWTIVVGNRVYSELRLGEMLLGMGNGIEYLPVKDLSLGIDAWLWGMRPFGFHLTNVVLYVAGVAAVHASVRRLAALFAAPHAGAIALWTALVFALHPLHAEVVNFVTARNTLLAGLFVFLSLRALLAGLEGRRDGPIAAALALFVLAAFSKATVVFFPVFVAVLLGLAPAITLRRRLAVSAAFLVTGAAVSWVHARNAAATGMMSYDALRFGTASAGAALAKAVQIPFFYLRLLLVPWPLSVEYASAFVSGAVLLRASIAAVALAAACGWAWSVRRRQPLAALGVAWMTLSLGPVLNLFPTSPVVADRYAYLAVFGFGLGAAALLAPRLEGERRSRALLAALAAVLVAWGALVTARDLAWRSDLSLWSSAVAADPFTGRLNLAEALWAAGRYREAVAQLQEGRRLGAEGAYRATFYEGRLAVLEGRLDDGLHAFEAALAEGGDGDPQVHDAIAEVQERRGADLLALEHYLKAAGTASGMTRSFGEAGRAGAERVRARFAPALEALRRRAAAAPGDLAAQAELAATLHSLGAYDEAEQAYQGALAIAPTRWELWYDLGLTQTKRNRCADAIATFERALELSGPNRDVLNNLGTCQIRLRRYADAERTFEAALQRFPDFLYATFNLGRTYFARGDRERSRAYFSRARAMAAGDAALQVRVDQYLRQLE